MACWTEDLKNAQAADAQSRDPADGPRSEEYWSSFLWDPERNQTGTGRTRGVLETMANHLLSCTNLEPDGAAQLDAREWKLLHPRSEKRQKQRDFYEVVEDDADNLDPQVAGPSTHATPSSLRHRQLQRSSSSSYLSPSRIPASSRASSLGPGDSISVAGGPASSASPAPPSRSASRVSLAPGADVGLLRPWSDQRQQRYRDLIGKITASAGLPLSWVDNRHFRQLREEFMPMAPPIGRHALRRTVLPNLRDSLRNDVRVLVNGANGTLQQDGWTGINHKHINAFMVAANGTVFAVRTEDASLERRTGD
ncbi:hypothetical protein CYLTODRAFT_427529 [Cylindrobasidium torrendii FP15055 ss-10]|uniref:Uncharacterized protein n=1 Tax=Cylindrobasidium torrendii FP15055 ss-10 TaxID=1314674 RepID=A0A0D7ATW8_9AGAR|nr:hypothetical protein CYLTODRAFT_427529 [Cylindrobasidium torrendii FP15055 ss-10]